MACTTYKNCKFGDSGPYGFTNITLKCSFSCCVQTSCGHPECSSFELSVDSVKVLAPGANVSYLLYPFANWAKASTSFVTSIITICNTVSSKK